MARERLRDPLGLKPIVISCAISSSRACCPRRRPDAAPFAAAPPSPPLYASWILTTCDCRHFSLPRCFGHAQPRMSQKQPSGMPDVFFCCSFIFSHSTFAFSQLCFARSESVGPSLPSSFASRIFSAARFTEVTRSSHASPITEVAPS